VRFTSEVDVKIATYNVMASMAVARVAAVARRVRPDVACLQELKAPQREIS